MLIAFAWTNEKAIGRTAARTKLRLECSSTCEPQVNEGRNAQGPLNSPLTCKTHASNLRQFNNFLSSTPASQDFFVLKVQRSLGN